jgi:carbonic anhydrase/acetyltransferase-like protein (isoleucine patch superfamily)
MRIKGVFHPAGTILEPWFIEINNNVVLGQNSVVTAHLFEDESLYLSKIILQENSTIGVFSVVTPGCVIGKDSVVAANSFVKKNTVIGDRQLWKGSPAKKDKNW